MKATFARSHARRLWKEWVRPILVVVLLGGAVGAVVVWQMMDKGGKGSISDITETPTECLPRSTRDTALESHLEPQHRCDRVAARHG